MSDATRATVVDMKRITVSTPLVDVLRRAAAEGAPTTRTAEVRDWADDRSVCVDVVCNLCHHILPDRTEAVAPYQHDKYLHPSYRYVLLVDPAHNERVVCERCVEELAEMFEMAGPEPTADELDEEGKRL